MTANLFAKLNKKKVEMKEEKTIIRNVKELKEKGKGKGTKTRDGNNRQMNECCQIMFLIILV